MVKVAIIYDTATHNTEMMANAEAFGVSSESEEAKLAHVHEATIEDIRDVDGLVLGSERLRHGNDRGTSY